MSGSVFYIDGEVRDSELDVQRGVSNHRIMEYLQHARHAYFRARGFDLVRLLEDQVDPVLRESRVKYLSFLTHADAYRVTVAPVRAGVQIHFLCAIFRKPDMKLCVKAIMSVVVSKDGQISRDNILEVDEGPQGRLFQPTYADIPDTWAAYVPQPVA